MSANLYAVIPAKAPLEGKSRLAPLLDPAARAALNLALARHTLEVCVESFGANRTIVVTGSAEIGAIALAAGAHVLDGPDVGSTPHESLNAAVRAGLALAQQLGASGGVIVPTDLPLLSADALSSALAPLPAARGCVLVGDRRGSGTNLLAMQPADPRLPAFGDDSLGRHAERARNLGYRTHIHRCERLGLDLDLPEDFRDLESRSGVMLAA